MKLTCSSKIFIFNALHRFLQFPLSRCMGTFSTEHRLPNRKVVILLCSFMLPGARFRKVILSKYGIRSLPSILIVNQTSRVRYRGSKDLSSMVQFYEKTTGFEPVQYIAQNEPVVSGDHNKYMLQLWKKTPMEIVKWEPYLAFALLFFCFRVLVSIFRELLYRLKAFWVVHTPHINLEIFGETSLLFARALHMVDVRRVWTKLRLCKTRNFHQGAKNARVWASSLASVSLGNLQVDHHIHPRHIKELIDQVVNCNHHLHTRLKHIKELIDQVVNCNHHLHLHPKTYKRAYRSGCELRTAMMIWDVVVASPVLFVSLILNLIGCN